MDTSASFVEFYNKLGLVEYPFAQWSAEQEEKRQKELFIRPSYYGPIDEKFQAGAGMFLVGERGTGKTAALYDLVRSARKAALVVEISDYSDISVEYSPTELYRLIISRIVDALLLILFKSPSKFRKISNPKRLLLSYAYNEFTTPTSKGELNRNIEKIQSSFLKRAFFVLYGFLRGPLNLSATFATNLVTELISKSVGIDGPAKVATEVRQFFPDIPFRTDNTFNSLPASLRLLERLAEIGNDIGLGKVIVVVDKLDEDPKLDGDAEKISEFVRGVVTETSLHLSRNTQIIASIWSVPFSMLQKTGNVRTQKMNVETLSWDRRDLERALDNRLSVYSNRAVQRYKSLFAENVSLELYDLIFQLANHNPRDLWHAFDYIIKEQYKSNPDSIKISPESIKLGLKSFVSNFNYFEYYPRRANARANSMDVYAYIRHLLRLSGPEFTRNQLAERSGVSGGSTSNYVQGMENMGLISSKGQTGGHVNYVIRDPKVRYALENSIDISAA